MNPWQLFWAPQFHFPFGGSVAQRIEPNTNWFFGTIQPGAGDGVIEKKAFEIASYGKQLGVITDLLLDLAAITKPSTEEGERALDTLRDIRKKIEELKLQDLDATAADIETAVLASDFLAKHGEGKSAKKVIVVPGRMVNVVM